MQGDFSLNALAYRDGVSRVLSQRGRVQLDSDINEQTESLLRFLRGLAVDVIGAHGGVGDAFKLDITGARKSDVSIRWGSYYVDGIRCVNFPADHDLLDTVASGAFNGGQVSFATQPYSVAPHEGDWTMGANDAPVLFYLDVFERHLSAAEDDSLREVALFGVDTTSRAVVVWQVRTMPAAPFQEIKRRLTSDTVPVSLPPTWDAPYVALNWLMRSNARLRARAVITEATDACTISPDARYRGIENSLFRVEIHDDGQRNHHGQKQSPPTFKWSPDNASLVYPVRHVDGKTVLLDSLGRDDRTAINVNDWVEVVDDSVILGGVANPLLQVVKVRPHEMSVELSDAPRNNAGSGPHAILRRWASPAQPVRESTPPTEAWIALTDGVEVQFSHVPPGAAASYRTGDYWLIPTRTATGDVQWQQESGGPRAVAPHGIEHHYAPLALADPKTQTIVEPYWRHFNPIAIV
jgi:hypothetical protein